ncbi:LURP-one-related/scramblase family protein [Sphaerisporangium corydalis]|uniref:LURP-one-related/scramblase family protein n=1 Tax=Sphaerisporangium corydalis TaxID=1441875 RepID=A0ABV9EMZ5_9ACTN|nr:LURP-one-related family protein [Sphaerisporangium corydalis]
MKFQMRERMFSIGDDYWIEDESGHRAFLVDGKALRIRQTFELKGPEGEVLAVIKKKMISIRDTMIVERDGDTVAKVHKKLFSPLRHKMVVELADGQEWTATGDIIEKNYTIEGDQGVIAETSRKWFRIRETYGIEVTHPDVPLVLAVAVAVEELADESRHKDDKDNDDD